MHKTKAMNLLCAKRDADDECATKRDAAHEKNEMNRKPGGKHSPNAMSIQSSAYQRNVKSEKVNHPCIVCVCGKKNSFSGDLLNFCFVDSARYLL